MLQRQLSHLNNCTLDHRQVEASYVLSVSGFTMSYTANMFIIMVLYDLRLLPAKFYYTVVYIRKIESCVQIADLCAPWKISSGLQNLGLPALQF
jgi:hypothetical protein